MIESALNLADCGYAVMPCKPNAKQPLTAHGLNDATSDASQVEAWWTATPLANVAIRTDGLFVLDIDGPDNPWLASLPPEQALSLAVAPMSRTPRGGCHRFFRQPDGRTMRNTAGKLAPNVDTRANGGYVLVPPSVVDGKPYGWADGCLDVSPDRLPEPPSWLLDALDAVGNLASVKLTAAETSDVIPAGQRNAELTRIAGKLRRIDCSRDVIFGALQQENKARCRPPLADDELRTIANSVVRYAPDDVATAVAEGRLAIGIEPCTGPIDPGPFPDELLKVPGFIADVCDFNLAGAFKPQPVLALAGALSLLATLTGRKVADEYGTRTNLYCIAIADTGAGKERARQVNKDILMMAGLDRFIGPESIGSSAGLITAVEQEPALLIQLDEIGRYLKAIGDSHQPHLLGIITVLLKLFTSSSSLYIGDAYADAKRVKKIYQPHVCLYGTTVPQSLYEGLTSESLTDGFLSRTLIFEGAEGARQTPIKVNPPKHIVEVAREWGDFKPGGNTSSVFPQPIVIPSTVGANAIMEQLETLAERENSRLGAPLGPLWTRATEKARTLALLWACSGGIQSQVIDDQAARWAAMAIEHLTRRMIFIANQWIASSPYEAKVKRLMRIIDNGGPNGASRTTINNGTGLPMRERLEILIDLEQRGLVFKLEQNTGGRPAVRYVSSRFATLLAG